MDISDSFYSKAHFSTGAVAQSFTSTATDRVTLQETGIHDRNITYLIYVVH
jgi:hypothetical protein